MILLNMKLQKEDILTEEQFMREFRLSAVTLHKMKTMGVPYILVNDKAYCILYSRRSLRLYGFDNIRFFKQLKLFCKTHKNFSQKHEHPVYNVV